MLPAFLRACLRRFLRLVLIGVRDADGLDSSSEEEETTLDASLKPSPPTPSSNPSSSLRYPYSSSPAPSSPSSKPAPKSIFLMLINVSCWRSTNVRIQATSLPMVDISLDASTKYSYCSNTAPLNPFLITSIHFSNRSHSSGSSLTECFWRNSCTHFSSSNPCAPNCSMAASRSEFPLEAGPSALPEFLVTEDRSPQCFCFLSWRVVVPIMPDVSAGGCCTLSL
mmetsp:Transcript_33590/g.71631  ORF Transcript_33590/g.71631 Transcript_33590/m.71631 type:complete len:224 (-) Transcript_33590:187-858(-)